MRKWTIFLEKQCFEKLLEVLFILVFIAVCENSASAIGIYDCGEYEVEGFLTELDRNSKIDLILEKGAKVETVIHFKASDTDQLKPYVKSNVRVRLLIAQACSKNCHGTLQKIVRALDPTETPQPFYFPKNKALKPSKCSESLPVAQ